MVATVKELKNRVPANLTKKMTEVNEQKKINPPCADRIGSYRLD